MHITSSKGPHRLLSSPSISLTGPEWDKKNMAFREKHNKSTGKFPEVNSSATTNLRKYCCQMILPIIEGWHVTRNRRKFSFHEVLQQHHKEAFHIN